VIRRNPLKAFNDHIRDNFDLIRSKQLTSYASDFLDDNKSSPAEFKKGLYEGLQGFIEKR